MFREYLADGRFEQYLADELQQSRAEHLDEVRKSLATLRATAEQLARRQKASTGPTDWGEPTARALETAYDRQKRELGAALED